MNELILKVHSKMLLQNAGVENAHIVVLLGTPRQVYGNLCWGSWSNEGLLHSL